MLTFGTNTARISKKYNRDMMQRSESNKASIGAMNGTLGQE
jgi:hypothetical protein